jgi:hypothetical protein
VFGLAALYGCNPPRDQQTFYLGLPDGEEPICLHTGSNSTEVPFQITPYDRELVRVSADAAKEVREARAEKVAAILSLYARDSLGRPKDGLAQVKYAAASVEAMARQFETRAYAQIPSDLSDRLAVLPKDSAETARLRWLVDSRDGKEARASTGMALMAAFPNDLILRTCVAEVMARIGAEPDYDVAKRLVMSDEIRDMGVYGVIAWANVLCYGYRFEREADVREAASLYRGIANRAGSGLWTSGFHSIADQLDIWLARERQHVSSLDLNGRPKQTVASFTLGMSWAKAPFRIAAEDGPLVVATNEVSKRMAGLDTANSKREFECYRKEAQENRGDPIAQAEFAAAFLEHRITMLLSGEHFPKNEVEVSWALASSMPKGSAEAARLRWLIECYAYRGGKPEIGLALRKVFPNDTLLQTRVAVVLARSGSEKNYNLALAMVRPEAVRKWGPRGMFARLSVVEEGHRFGRLDDMREALGTYRQLEKRFQGKPVARFYARLADHSEKQIKELEAKRARPG